MNSLIGMAVLLVGLILCAGIAVGIFNRLVRGRVLVREGFSGIDVQLKRRHDLIPNLVSTVRGYAGFEQKVLSEVTRLRTQAMGGQSLADKTRDEGELSGALKTLFAVAEDYPDLKASSSFLDLQRQLVEIEDHIEKSRRYYNGTVRELNTRVQSFPNNLVAGMFGFERAEFFGIENPDDRALPQVELQPSREN